MTGENLAVVLAGVHEFEAQAKVALLAERGIQATIVWESLWSQGGVLPHARRASVCVRRDQADHAADILRRAAGETGDIDWDQVDVGEREDDLPLRPVTHVPILARISFALAATILVLAALGALAMIVW